MSEAFTHLSHTVFIKRYINFTLKESYPICLLKKVTEEKAG